MLFFHQTCLVLAVVLDLLSFNAINLKWLILYITKYKRVHYLLQTVGTVFNTYVLGIDLFAPHSFTSMQSALAFTVRLKVCTS